MAFWHFGVSFREHLAHCPSPVIVTSLSSAARLISDRPEQRTATASNESSFRIVILLPNEDYPGREAARGPPDSARARMPSVGIGAGCPARDNGSPPIVKGL